MSSKPSTDKTPSDTKTVRQDYNGGLSVELTTGSRRKQLLSNHLRIDMDGDRTGATMVLTTRQARALRGFLNKNLD